MESNLKKDKIRNKSHLHINLYVYWVLLMAWQLFRPTSNRSLVDILVKVCLILFLIVSAARIRLLYPKSNAIIFILFTFYMLLNMFVNEKAFNASIIITYFFPILFSFFFLIRLSYYQITKEEYFKFLNLIIIADLVMVGYSLIFQFGKFKNALTITNAYGYELSSFFLSNHEYALYLLLGFQSCLFCYHFITDTKRNGNTKYIFIALLFLINIVLTFSRTALLGAAVLIIVYILLSKNNRVRNIMIFSIIILFLLLLFSDTMRNFVLKIVLKDNNDAGRLEMWDYGIRAFNDSSILEKIIGQGYSKVLNDLFLFSNHKSFHNAYIQVLLQYGIIGFIFFVGIILTSILNGIKTMRKNRFLGVMFVSMSLSMIAYMFTNTTLIMQSSIDSYILTIFIIIIPKYVNNSIEQNLFE